ncbi:hypothetical protein T261_1538 [Streptomyces lydicus]|nr:hypothetical protein T261_1538 [Streptomyces lydicus]
MAARRTRRAQYKAYSRLGSRFLDVSDVHVELTGQERLRGDVWCGTFDAHLRRTQGAAGSLVFTAGVLEVEAGVGRSA